MHRTIGLALGGNPGARHAAAMGVPISRTTLLKRVRTGDAGPDDALASELIELCRARIAHFKCPTSVVFVDSLPRLPSGKLAKRLLPASARVSAGATAGAGPRRSGPARP